LRAAESGGRLSFVQRTKKRAKPGRPPVRERLDPGLTLIKKYGNRRLYDTRRSRYVTLGEVHDIIAAGEEIKVVDAKTGADLTKLVVTKIIFLEEQRRRLDLLPLAFLTKLLQVPAPATPVSAEIEELKARILSLEARVK
jgi:polyhydroxyalkanoate synthesis repressor PhaR